MGDKIDLRSLEKYVEFIVKFTSFGCFGFRGFRHKATPSFFLSYVFTVGLLDLFYLDNYLNVFFYI